MRLEMPGLLDKPAESAVGIWTPGVQKDSVSLRLPVRIHEHPHDAVDEARTHGCRILAASPRGGRPLFETDLEAPCAVLIGGEGPGLPAAVLESADALISIPMEPPVESLNAAVTAAVILYEARRQRELGKVRGKKLEV